jgi:hypothetical protein
MLVAAFFLFACSTEIFADRILVPMDDEQHDHLRSYGLAYWVLDQRGQNVEWLLNYRAGSFLTDDHPAIRNRAKEVGVSFEIVTEGQVSGIYAILENENMERVLLEKAPKMGVYSPDYAEPWDDAVVLALDYAKIPYETFYDDEVVLDKISHFDWIHLHHEDFTGQFGKFYGSYRFAEWYRQMVTRAQLRAQKLGFQKVPQLKLAVARGIRKFVLDGGFMFAMCSACDALDIALAANGVDIVESVLDGDPMDPLAQQKLDFSQTFAFEKFTLMPDPMIYEYSDIDVSNNYVGHPGTFKLFDFSAKVDPIPSMLTQNHRNVLDGFFGQTTAFRTSLIKSGVTILAESNDGISTKYIRGDYGKGTFCFYGGHDPADVAHFVGEGPTNLALHKNSPGYRLILNNVLFPAARKKERKT